MAPPGGAEEAVGGAPGQGPQAGGGNLPPFAAWGAGDAAGTEPGCLSQKTWPCSLLRAMGSGGRRRVQGALGWGDGDPGGQAGPRRRTCPGRHCWPEVERGWSLAPSATLVSTF